MHILLTIFVLVVVCLPASAKFDWNHNCQSAYTATINLKFEQAKLLVTLEKQKNPENSLVYLIENYIDYLVIQIGEEESDFQRLKTYKDSRISNIINDDAQSPWALYSQAEIHLQWSANRLKFGDYFTAAYEIRKAYKLLEKNNVLYPDFLPNGKSLGLLYSLLGSVPERYQWILTVAGMQGDLKNGFVLLEQTMERMKKDNVFSVMLDETYFLYSFLKMNLDNNKEDLNNVLNDIKDSQNILLNFAASRLATKTAQNDLAIKILENRTQSSEIHNFLYLDYLLGIGKLNQIKKDCLLYFNRYLTKFDGKNYKKSTLMRMSWFAFINDDTTAYYTYKEQINSVGSMQIDADKEAQNFYRRKQKPNKALLKARLYFDGGYYQKALNELNQISPNKWNDLHDELDYYYRLGRTHEQLNETNLALVYYNKAFVKGAKEQYFFAAKSSLQMALIYENKKDFKLAEEYFKTTIGLKNHLYEQSIEQKAKAGLERIN